jgi:hypothetical protein
VLFNCGSEFTNYANMGIWIVDKLGAWTPGPATVRTSLLTAARHGGIVEYGFGLSRPTRSLKKLDSAIIYANLRRGNANNGLVVHAGSIQGQARMGLEKIR